jgi:hypothetical protein
MFLHWSEWHGSPAHVLTVLTPECQDLNIVATRERLVALRPKLKVKNIGHAGFDELPTMNHFLGC